MATWRQLIGYAMQAAEDPEWDRGTGETWDDVVRCTLTDAELDTEFDEGYGGTEGKPFTLWTGKYVYFPVCYDGAESVGFVPRHPCDTATRHWGGG